MKLEEYNDCDCQDFDDKPMRVVDYITEFLNIVVSNTIIGVGLALSLSGLLVEVITLLFYMSA